ncbi:hypothetical protein HS088_TW16G00824 [Tripterygium wilfordii]|uniref:Uncharacterized protein n=1 Tax=Tripterygium wilfordii TaxID=458696 RepID=A0A7J7CJX5_TRIWF|nr:uncharacterized protein LOC119981465 [Tripterygium wilfordii]KAF5734375.1 hypothetical protein HS088_TW16G00824 [Tripterygium wilfordii]
MGNCLLGGFGDGDGRRSSSIKVITSNGGIMEFTTPITAGSISKEFPNHAIFPSHDLFWKPLPNHKELQLGNSYYLLPLNTTTSLHGQVVRHGHVRSNSIPSSSSVVAPYRMSFVCERLLKRSYTDVFNSRYGNYNSGGGIWKVKLVISPEQLLEILSQEGPTQDLIESISAVAKCGNHGSSSNSISVSGFSDEWSLSSGSRNASCNKVDLLETFH